MAEAGVVEVPVRPTVSSAALTGTRNTVLGAFKNLSIALGLDSGPLKRAIDAATRDVQSDLNRINTDAPQGQMKRLGDVGNTQLGRIDAKAKATGQSMVVLGAGAAVLGTKLISGLGSSVQAASDLNETISKSEVIFGSGAASAEAFAEKAAKGLGQSKQQALDALSIFATFGKGAGLAGQDLVDFSTRLDSLAGDLASFFNTDPSDAITAITAGLRGESEPLRAYGVLLDDATLRQEALRQGLIKTTSQALTPQQRVLAAQAVILRQTGDAQGDFARTADGLANSQRTLTAEQENSKASLGQGLLPVWKEAVHVGDALIGTLGKIPGATTALGIGLFGVGAAAVIGGTVSAIAGGVKVVQSLTTASAEAAVSETALGAASTEAAAGVGTLGTTAATSAGEVEALGAASATSAGEVSLLGRAGAVGLGAMKVAGAALIGIGIGAAVVEIANSIGDFDRKVQESLTHLQASSADGGRQFVESFVKSAREAEAQPEASDILHIGESIAGRFKLGGIGDSGTATYFKQTFESLRQASPQIAQQFIDTLKKMNDQLPRTGNDFKSTSPLIKEWQRELDDANGAAKAAADAAGRLGGGIDGAGDAALGASQKLDRFGNAVDQSKGKWEQYTDSLTGILDPISAAISAQAALAAGQDRVTEARKKLTEVESGTSDALISARASLVDADKGLTKAIEDNAKKVVDAERQVADAKKSLEGAKEKGGAQEEGGKAFEQGPKRDMTIARDIQSAQDKVKEAEDNLADARRGNDIADAVERRAAALKKVNDEQAKLAPGGEAMVKAQQELNDAQRALPDLVLASEAAEAKLRDEISQHPDIIGKSVDKIDEWTARGLISADVARQWKEELTAAAAAAQGLTDSLAEGTPFWDLVKGTVTGKNQKAPDFPNALTGAFGKVFAQNYGTNPDGTFNLNTKPSVPTSTQVPTSVPGMPTEADFLNSFPKNPEVGQRATVGGKKFIWDGTTWVVSPYVPFGFADGGFNGFSGGGFPTDPTMQPTVLGGMHKVVQAFESDAGKWESYIPEAPAKRPRAVGVLRQTADAFGYEVVPKRKYQIGGHVTAYADGGTTAPAISATTAPAQTNSGPDAVLAELRALRTFLAAVLNDRPNVNIDKLITLDADKQAGYQESLRQAELATYGAR